jgi:hypothetical protein
MRPITPGRWVLTAALLLAAWPGLASVRVKPEEQPLPFPTTPPPAQRPSILGGTLYMTEPELIAAVSVALTPGTAQGPRRSFRYLSNTASLDEACNVYQESCRDGVSYWLNGSPSGSRVVYVVMSAQRKIISRGNARDECITAGTALTPLFAEMLSNSGGRVTMDEGNGNAPAGTARTWEIRSSLQERIRLTLTAHQDTNAIDCRWALILGAEPVLSAVPTTRRANP